MGQNGLMAQRTIVTIGDDLDGSEGAESVVFSFKETVCQRLWIALARTSSWSTMNSPQLSSKLFSRGTRVHRRG